MTTKAELIELIKRSSSLARGNAETPKGYLASLRQMREELASGIVSSAPAEVQARYRHELLTKAKNIQNRTRGKLGELLGRVALTQRTVATDSDLETDKIVFDTPFGKRRIDVYWKSERVAIETKMGYITYSAGIRSQIEKDAYLIQHGVVSSIVWLLINGGSAKAKWHLSRHGILVNEGWPCAA